MKSVSICFGVLLSFFVVFIGQAFADLATALNGHSGEFVFSVSGYSSCIYDGVNDWGVLSVTDVSLKKNSTSIWSESGSDHIYAFFYGFFGRSMTDNQDGTHTIAMGWGKNSPYNDGSWDDTPYPGFAVFETATSIDFSVGAAEISGYIDGTKSLGDIPLMYGDFDSGVTDDPNDLLIETVASPYSPTTGSGNGYATISGGQLYSQLHCLEITDEFSGLHDMYFALTYTDPGTEYYDEKGWKEKLDGTITVDPVPEPSTLILLGAGLIQLFEVKKKRNSNI